MILKLQRPLVTNGPAEILAYNEDQSFTTMIPYTKDAEAIFGDENKIYVRAQVPRFDKGYVKIDEILEEQDW